MYLLLAFAFAPILFFMLVWAIVTAGRILFPEKPMPFDREFSLRGWRMRSRYRVPIPSAALRPQPVEDETSGYSFEAGRSAGLPTAWYTDLWDRRN
jgi:hypothetical protein